MSKQLALEAWMLGGVTAAELAHVVGHAGQDCE